MAALSKYALCSVDDVKDMLGTDDDDDSRDDAIIRAINALSWSVPRRAQREFARTSAEDGQRRFIKIQDDDATRGYIRVGDMRSEPTDVTLWTPDRDENFPYDVETDLWLMPDVPERGFPWEFIKIKAAATPQPIVGWWLSVTTDWGFPEIPEDIVEVAVGSSMLWILNDVAKLTALAREQGRKVNLQSLIPDEFIETVDNYRLYRVS